MSQDKTRRHTKCCFVISNHGQLDAIVIAWPSLFYVQYWTTDNFFRTVIKSRPFSSKITERGESGTYGKPVKIQYLLLIVALTK